MNCFDRPVSDLCHAHHPRDNDDIFLIPTLDGTKEKQISNFSQLRPKVRRAMRVKEAWICHSSVCVYG